MHHQLAWLKVLNSLTQEQKAVLRSASEAGASAAFYAIPSSKHLFIRTDLYIIQARDRIMLPGVDDDIPPCRSNPCANQPPTTYDDKDLACRALRRHQHNSAHTTRHNLVVKEFAAMFRAMEVPVTFEPIVISTPSEERRGDLLIRDPSGNNVIYDVSIVDPSGHAYSQLAAKQAGRLARQPGPQRKTKSISTQHSAADARFLSPSSLRAPGSSRRTYEVSSAGFDDARRTATTASPSTPLGQHRTLNNTGSNGSPSLSRGATHSACSRLWRRAEQAVAPSPIDSYLSVFMLASPCFPFCPMSSSAFLP